VDKTGRDRNATRTEMTFPASQTRARKRGCSPVPKHFLDLFSKKSGVMGLPMEKELVFGVIG
jgi:hypothetical protein